MAQARRIHPRKRPQQERSRRTVEALLTATARVLVRDGFDRTSTNQIAEVAGVNIGSLYQYFPNKEALVAALIDQHLADIKSVIVELLAEHESHDLCQFVHRIVAAYLRFHAANPKLHRVLLQQVPRVERINPVIAVRREVIALVREFLDAHAHRLCIADTERTAFMIVHIVDALTQAAVLERPTYLSDDDYVNAVSEIVVNRLRITEHVAR